ncbi:hypothetical protein RFI_20314 [Reticulomyxa filosa]|uniref:Uncharacterized protein n=1 Tax=Reticulomyxa filosa TaxID=46433 RepID=X6MSS3_RETFI|nr:hypothetical protein RFI_20314 [Reticulomyxa filosa]|eukprot:ETO17023.1 hypothetical protein RFI_20314 [Reticulomyxa filosa]
MKFIIFSNLFGLAKKPKKYILLNIYIQLLEKCTFYQILWVGYLLQFIVGYYFISSLSFSFVQRALLDQLIVELFFSPVNLHFIVIPFVLAKTIHLYTTKKKYSDDTTMLLGMCDYFIRIECNGSAKQRKLRRQQHHNCKKEKDIIVCHFIFYLWLGWFFHGLQSKKKKKRYSLFLRRMFLAFKETVFGYSKKSYKMTAGVIIVNGVVTMLMCAWMMIRGYTSEENVQENFKPKATGALLLWGIIGLFLSVLLTVMFVRKLFELVKTDVEMAASTATTTVTVTVTTIENLGNAGSLPSPNLFSTFAVTSRSISSLSFDRQMQVDHSASEFQMQHRQLIKTITKYCLLNGTAAFATWMGPFLFILRFQTGIGHINTLLNSVICCCVIVSACVYLQFSCTQPTYARVCHFCHHYCFQCVKGWMLFKLQPPHPPNADIQSIPDFIPPPSIDLQAHTLEAQSDYTNQ